MKTSFRMAGLRPEKGNLDFPITSKGCNDSHIRFDRCCYCNDLFYGTDNNEVAEIESKCEINEAF